MRCNCDRQIRMMRIDITNKTPRDLPSHDQTDTNKTPRGPPMHCERETQHEEHSEDTWFWGFGIFKVFRIFLFRVGILGLLTISKAFYICISYAGTPYPTPHPAPIVVLATANHHHGKITHPTWRPLASGTVRRTLIASWRKQETRL